MKDVDKKYSKDNWTFILLTVIASLLLILVIISVSKNNSSNSSPINSSDVSTTEWVGKKAPDFELEDFEGNKVSLATLKGKNVILFFTEGLMCYPACWDQMAKLGTDERF